MGRPAAGGFFAFVYWPTACNHIVSTNPNFNSMYEQEEHVPGHEPAAVEIAAVQLHELQKSWKLW